MIRFRGARSNTRFIPRHRAGVYIHGISGVTTVGMADAGDRARVQGRADAHSGQHTPYSPARVPPAVHAIEMRRDENAEFLRAARAMVVGPIDAEARDNARRRDAAEADLQQARAQLKDAHIRVPEVPEAQHGWLSLPGWALIAVAVLIAAADILLTKVALITAMGNIQEWEAWAIASLIGFMLFGAGLGKAYVEVVRDHATKAGEEEGPFGASDSKLLRFVFWPTLILLVGLAAGRIGLLNDNPQNIVEWIQVGGAFIAVTMAAVMVAVTTYMGGCILFASRPRSAALRAISRADKQVRKANRKYLRNARRQDDSQMRATGLDKAYTGAVTAAGDAWMAVIDAYWAGFGEVRPEQQPDVEDLHLLRQGRPTIARNGVTP